ncbi:hypothetical protein theurythT_27770 [Thalassotalea eurytherma]|uniref:Uncharacterized protein n=1 Tax=Thalassotalea eurytherma TaxID=1144278 RepID=A0ABQ6H594_9GAMM|nr:hypothetical protein theurythT_27770 [Thalassotalea eurytherma]
MIFDTYLNTYAEVTPVNSVLMDIYSLFTKLAQLAGNNGELHNKKALD